VHEEIVQIVAIGPNVLFCCKSGKTFSEDEDSERINSIKKDVDSAVKFKVVDQIGLVHISLHYVLVAWLQINSLVVSCKKNTSPLTRGNRLYNECFGFFLVELSLKVTGIRWEDPGFRKEVIFLREEFLHSFKVATKIVLVS
jgi:hypothetical protein